MLWRFWGGKVMKPNCRWSIGIAVLAICLSWLMPAYAAVIDQASLIRTPVSQDGANARRMGGGALGTTQIGTLEANGPATVYYTTNGETGSITGTVTDKDTGAGIQGAYVTAYHASDGSWAGGGNADSAGAYSISGLPSGSYKLQFSGNGYIKQWSGDKPDKKDAISITVTAPNTTSDINALLVKGGSITGTVTDQDTSAGIQGAFIIVYRVVGSSLAGFGLTDSSGAYSITGLASDSYQLRFSHDGYIEQWSGDQPDQQSATSVVVTAPNVTAGINAALVKGGSVTGTVTDKDTGAGIQGAYVSAYRASGSVAGGGLTDSSGVYSITNLASGSYKLRFSHDGYIPGWSGDKPDQQSAANILVTAPNVTADINASLVMGGIISGLVSGQDTGAGIANVYVYAIERNTATWVGGTTTDQNGAYTINGLASGSYRLEFAPPYGSDYIGRRYGLDQCTDAVIVTAPNAVTIDVSLVRGGSISGHLTDAATGSGIVGAVMYGILGPYNTIEWAGYLNTDATGAYTIHGLMGGEYSLSFSAPDYIGKPNSLKVSLAAGSVVTNADAALNRGGAISGRITDSVTGAAVSGVTVDAFGSPGSSAYDFTDDNGDYRISGLPSGSYTLHYDGRDRGYANGWYSDQPGGNPATPVTVAAPETTSAINFSISRVGAISGRVTDKSSNGPLNGIFVTAYDAATGAGAGSTLTNADGTYTIIGLPTGTYKIRFSSASQATRYYLSAWYGGVSSSGAASVAVQSPDTTLGIDAGLLKGGAISGLISANRCPGPRQVNIRAYDAASGDLVGQGWTDTYYSERFTIGGLPAGSYKLVFDAAYEGYLLQWYPNGATAATADPVVVAAEATTDGVNVSLAIGGGSISGYVIGQFQSGLMSDSVKLYDWSTGGFVAERSLYHSGYYQFSGLADASYKLLFTVNGQERWYRSVGETADASPVVVTGGSVVTGINIFLKGTIVINGGALYTTSPKVALSLGYYPAAAQMQLYFNGKSWSKPEPYATAKSITLPKGDGPKTVQVRYLAADGSSLGEYGATITLDTRLPSGTMTINGGARYTNSRTVTLAISAADVTSGIAGVCLKESSLPCGDGEFEPFAAGKTFTIATTGNGKKTIHATLRDLAGKTSKPIKASLIMDTIAPTGSIVINGGKAVTGTQLVTIKLKADKASEMMLSLDGGVTWGGWEKFVTSKKVTLAAGAETLVQIRFRDLAGNESGVITSTSVVGAEILDNYNFHPVGEPVVRTITLPAKLNYSGWETIEPLCQEVGYSLAPYRGNHVTLVTYSITEKWYSPIPTAPGEDLYLRVIGKNGITLCGYLTVREDSTAVPGVFALNDPNVR